jgi:hypothetical protein
MDSASRREKGRRGKLVSAVLAAIGFPAGCFTRISSWSKTGSANTATALRVVGRAVRSFRKTAITEAEGRLMIS